MAEIDRLREIADKRLAEYMQARNALQAAMEEAGICPMCQGPKSDEGNVKNGADSG